METIARQTASKRNNGGFSLVEVMVAIVITMVGLLGLVEAMGLATAANLKNQLRDEAVLIGEEQMADLFRRPQAAQITFDTLSTPSKLRGGGNTFGITRSAEKVLNTSSYRLTVNVTWTLKQVPYQHQVQAIRTYNEKGK